MHKRGTDASLERRFKTQIGYQMDLDTEQMIPVSEVKRRPWTRGEPLERNIQYACGRMLIDGWTNVDGFNPESYPFHSVPASLVDRIYHVDLTAQHPFPDDCFEFGFAEDFIEHLTQRDSLTFLSEALRTLKPGGVLRLSAPGLRQVLETHFKRPTFDILKFEQRNAYDTWDHQHFYCHETLEMVALSLGFSSYKACRSGESIHASLQSRETRPHQAKHNIHAELTK